MAEAERIKPRALYEEEAIEHARGSHWAEAVATNRALLERYGSDEGAHNRLGKALLELGRLRELVEEYGKALELNPLNAIAQKNCTKIAAMLQAPQRVAGSRGKVDASLFTEEPGKSALTTLTPPSGGVSVTVVPGDAVELETDGASLHARTARGVALGDIDAKIARRLLPLIQTGNRYTAAVARVQDDRIEVMLREVHQSPENTRKSSFPIAKGVKRDEFRGYARDTLLANREIDDSGYDGGDDEPVAATDDGSLLTGMHGTDADDEDGIAVVDDDEDDVDEPDDDSRPEDQY